MDWISADALRERQWRGGELDGGEREEEGPEAVSSQGLRGRVHLEGWGLCSSTGWATKVRLVCSGESIAGWSMRARGAVPVAWARRMAVTTPAESVTFFVAHSTGRGFDSH